MRLSNCLMALVLLSASGCTSVPRPTVVITNATEDHPFNISSSSTEEYYRVIQPAVDEARRTYPSARSRFLAGLPEDHHFFVTVRLVDSVGNSEQFFILVDAIRHGTIYGRIWSQIQVIKGFERGQAVEVAESELLDWTILDGAGAEEGNFIGKVLDKLQAVGH